MSVARTIKTEMRSADLVAKACASGRSGVKFLRCHQGIIYLQVPCAGYNLGTMTVGVYNGRIRFDGDFDSPELQRALTTLADDYAAEFVRDYCHNNHVEIVEDVIDEHGAHRLRIRT